MKIKLHLQLVAVVALPLMTLAEDAVKPDVSDLMRFCQRDYLLGDWGGRRTALKEKGVDFEVIYFSAVPSNLEGGAKRGSVYEGALLMMLDLDSEKLLGYHGGQLHVGGVNIHNTGLFSGSDTSANYVGDLNKVSLLDHPPTWQLWELWYEQKFLNDKVALKFGQLAVDRDFILPEFYNSCANITLLNQTFFYPKAALGGFDQPGFPTRNHGLATTPYSAPGVRLRIDPCQYAYFQLGAYAGNPDRTHGGTDFTVNGDEGALLYFELTLKINQSKEASGPPGNLKVGGYYHTGDFVDRFEGAHNAFDTLTAGSGLPPLSPGPARDHGGNYGFYLLADQMLWRETDQNDPAHQGLAGFFRVATAPSDRNLAELGIDGGLVYNGLIPSRDWDTLALAYSYLKISEDLRNAQRDINTHVVNDFSAPAPFTKIADYESVLEISYKMQLTAWMTVQASFQRVFHPGGRVLYDLPDASVFIVQTSLRF